MEDTFQEILLLKHLSWFCVFFWLIYVWGFWTSIGFYQDTMFLFCNKLKLGFGIPDFGTILLLLLLFYFDCLKVSVTFQTYLESLG